MISKSFFLLVCIFLLVFLLRIYHIDSLPPGLYIDEAAIGVNAYSLLTLGVDEYGIRYPLWFRSFGDFKPPLYIYITSASMILFGKSEFAIRLPSVFFGTLSVIVLYFLVKYMANIHPVISQKGSAVRLGLLSAYILAISPWHVQFSRAGFEANLGLFFFMAATLCMVLFWKYNRILLLFLSLFLYVATVYTYHSYRIITPVALIPFMFILFSQKKTGIKYYVPILLLMLFLSLPAIVYTFSFEGIARFYQTTAFSTMGKTSIIQKTVEIIVIYIRNYVSYFSSRFLLASGDGIGRHQMVGFGLIASWNIIFLAAVFWMIIKDKSMRYSIIVVFSLSLLLLSPLAGAFSLPSPHTLRSLLSVVPYSLLTAMGIVIVEKKMVREKIIRMLFPVLLTGLVMYQLVFYLHYYFLHYSNNNSLDWGGGFKQTVAAVTSLQNRYKHIVVRKDLGLSYVYFRFYNENLQPLYVDFLWDKPAEWKDGEVLFVTSYIPPGDNRPQGKLIHQSYLPNINRDVFAQFWQR